MRWDENFVNAKYHLAVAERMLVSYGEVGDKRFFVGVINEAARAVSFLIEAARSFASRGNGKLVMGDGGEKKILLRYIDGVTCENLFKVLEVWRAQRESPIEYAKGDKIILLVDGKYRILTIGRIREFVKSIGDGISAFSGNLRQV